MVLSTEEWINTTYDLLKDFLFMLKGQRARVLYTEKQLASLTAKLIKCAPLGDQMTFRDILIKANQTAQEFRRKDWNPQLRARIVDASTDFVIMYRIYPDEELSRLKLRMIDIVALDWELVDKT